MPSIDRIEALGVEPRFFRLPHAVGGFDKIEYYLIQRESGVSLEVQQSGEWDLLAVGIPSRNPHEFVLRQIHIEKEALHWPSFNAWTDSTDLQSFNPPTLEVFRTFLITLSERLPITHIASGLHTYFAPASVLNYAACGIPQALLDRFLIRFQGIDTYRYEPDELVTKDHACCFLQVSRWTLPVFSPSSTLFVAFETYTEERIEAIQQAWEKYIENQAATSVLEVGMMDEDHTLRFTRGALIAVSDLLGDRLRNIAREQPI